MRKRIICFLGATITILLAVLVSFSRIIPGTEAHAIARVEQDVSRKLIDPPSALFRNVKSINGHACGEVNSKNSLGGYVGYKRFMSDDLSSVSVSVIDYFFHPYIISEFDPEFNMQTFANDTEYCNLVRENPNLNSEYRQACSQVEIDKSQRTSQLLFDASWVGNVCSGSGAAHEAYKAAYQAEQASYEESAAVSAAASEAAAAASSTTTNP